jgi:hypothetical protein
MPGRSSGGAGYRGFRPGPVGARRGGGACRCAGPEAALSKSTVSQVCAEIKSSSRRGWQRRLDDVELDCPFLDGSHFKYHANAAAEPVLARGASPPMASPALECGSDQDSKTLDA